MMDDMKVTVIDWVDIVVYGGWRKDYEKPAVCRSVGYIVEETDTHIVLAATVGGEGEAREWNQCVTIPKGCITKVE